MLALRLNKQLLKDAGRYRYIVSYMRIVYVLGYLFFDYIILHSAVCFALYLVPIYLLYVCR
jgi:hypothetical protein